MKKRQQWGLTKLKLYLKQKVFSWRDRFFVKDESGNDCYAVEGATIPFIKQLRVFDATGNVVAQVEQKSKGFSMFRFTVDINGREACVIVKKFAWIGHKYNIEGLSWQLRGDFSAHEYELLDGNRVVMKIDKKIISWGDSYELDIADPKHELLYLCIALAVDCSLDIQNRQRRRV